MGSMHAVEGQYHIGLWQIEEVKPEDIWYYKDKPYCIMEETKIKVGSEWWDAIIYQCLYDNPDGMIWVRFKKDFFDLFKNK